MDESGCARGFFIDMFREMMDPAFNYTNCFIAGHTKDVLPTDPRTYLFYGWGYNIYNSSGLNMVGLCGPVTTENCYSASQTRPILHGGASPILGFSVRMLILYTHPFLLTDLNQI